MHQTMQQKGQKTMYRICHSLTFFLLVIALMVNSGCVNYKKQADAEKFIEDLDNQPKKPIEPLPEVTPYVSYTYTAKTMRSPFVPSKPAQQQKKVVATGGIHPDLNRRKEPLENYALDSLKMVGTIEKDQKVWALVADPNGTVYRVTKGSYLGQNHGRIDAITANKMTLTEIIPDPGGGWKYRQAQIVMSDEAKTDVTTTGAMR